MGGTICGRGPSAGSSPSWLGQGGVSLLIREGCRGGGRWLGLTVQDIVSSVHFFCAHGPVHKMSELLALYCLTGPDTNIARLLCCNAMQ
jgi:hypothetical protein